MAPKKKQAKSVPSAQVFTSETFQGFNMKSDGKRPTTRHKPLPETSNCEDRRREKRETERKRLGKMMRQNIKLVEAAIANKKILNFRMRDFLVDKEGGKVRMEGGGPFPGLEKEVVSLTVAGGAAVLVDLEGVVLFWYFPNYIGQGLQRILLDRLTALVRVYPPKTDKASGDRRSKVATNPTAPSSTKRTTRSEARRAAAECEALEENQQPLAEEQCDVERDKSGAGGTSSSEDEAELAEVGSPNRYTEAEGGVGWRGGQPEENRNSGAIPADAWEQWARVLDATVMPPGAYHLTPGWYQTGMENVYPIAMSLQFREGLREISSEEMIAFLEGKRLYDLQIAHLTDIIHSSLASSMRQLRETMSEVSGPTSTVLENGWTSCFPCFAVGINRHTEIHRDTKGLNAGMDIIGVLGKFSGGQNGKFKLQDLNVVIEWDPRCLGAFDGYSLTHEVLEWEKGFRVTFISFCRKSTWTGLKLDINVTRPTLSQVLENLKVAQTAYDKVADETKRKSHTRPHSEGGNNQPDAKKRR